MRNTFIVAELSANHNQDINIAKESIKAAIEAGANAVKIQTYTADTLTIDCSNDYFKISQGTIWDGETLYDLYKRAYTPWQWFPVLKKYANSLGAVFFSTPFDNSAIDYLEEQENPIYKIASFEITDIDLINYAARKRKPMIISTGVGSIAEIQEAVNICHRAKNYDVTLLKCTSSYPAPLDQINLKTMVNMKETFRVKVGLSDHTIGSDVAIAATALGADVIEKHFILDRTLGGPDADFSMEPSDFAKMVESIRNVETSLGSIDYNLSDYTLNNRKFSRSLFIIEDIKKGELFSNRNISSIRPGDGLSPKYYSNIIGRRARDTYPKGTPLKWSMIE